jgi:hypothetical protein
MCLFCALPHAISSVSLVLYAYTWFREQHHFLSQLPLSSRKSYIKMKLLEMKLISVVVLKVTSYPF